jgi:hypothetical protein
LLVILLRRLPLLFTTVKRGSSFTNALIAWGIG